MLVAVGALAAPSGAEVAATPVLQLVGKFDSPIYATAPLHEDHLLFVVERPGRIRVVRDGVVLPQPFLDITGLVSANGEGGLLSVAFPPRYWQSGRFVVYYTDLGGSIEIVEYRRSASDPELAETSSARPILTIPHPLASNHYGGALQFGPDGLLYVGTGDGGGGGDQFGNSRNLGSLLGKLLRVDPFSGTPYAVPATNPFGGVAGARAEIFAYGLRNPFRFSFDRATGDLVIGDVGQASWEEVDAVRAPLPGGLDFGWNVYEGSHAFGPGSAPDAVLPVLEYPHTPTECSITGGVVVRDPALTTLVGRYLYGDWCGGWTHSVQLGFPSASGVVDTGLNVPQPVAYGEDAGGCVYVVSLAGPVYRLAAAPAAAVPCADAPPETTITSAPASTTGPSSFAFISSEAGSSFECRLDGGDWAGCASPVTNTLSAGAHVFEVRATDAGGTVDPTPATAALTVPEQPTPPPTPTTPTPTTPTLTTPTLTTPEPDPTPTPPTVPVPVPAPPPAAVPVAAPPNASPRPRKKGVTRLGTSRRDTLIGTARDDTLEGRRGDDLLRGLGGNDLLLGGAGRDRLYGGAGNDRVLARDGQRDLVDCGRGRDTAIIDRMDVVTGCEHATRNR